MIDANTSAILATGLLFVLLALGVPVAFSMGLAGVGGLYLIGGWSFTIVQMQTLPYSLASNYALAVMPGFLFMGNLVMHGGIAEELFTSANKWFGHMKGGLYLTVIAGCTAFAAISGSPLANTTVSTRIALPEMLRLGYHRGLSGACIAAAGPLAAMIPPSMGMVVYGVVVEQSIGKLMIAGIIPGLIQALFFAALIMLWVRKDPSVAPATLPKAPLRDRIVSSKDVWPVIAIFLCIMGGIYGGYFSPSAAGEIGAFATLIIVLLRRRLTWKGLVESLKSSAETTSMLFLIVICGMIFSRMLVFSGFVNNAVKMAADLNLGTIPLLLGLSVIYIILGCLMDGISMLLISLPFIFPVIVATGIDPIYFGILVILYIEIGAITPPIGLTLFATVGAADGMVTLEEILKKILPFILVECILLGLLLAFPQIVLWLPQHMEF
jgi:C4-dicarboxylate transporter DctM subunit